MARHVHYGPTESVPTDGDGHFAVDLGMPLGPNFRKDFLPVVDDPGVSIYSDMTSPIDQPSTIRCAVRDVPNIYAGSTIDPAVFLASRKGRDIVAQVQEVHLVTDDGDPSYQRMYPIKCTITLNVPLSSDVSPEAQVRMVARAVGALALNKDDGVEPLLTGLAALDRGITTK